MSGCGCSPLGPECGPAFANLLWVNGLATAVGKGSVSCPFKTPAEAVAAVPSGASATIILAPGDYSATTAISYASKDITFECLGAAANGTRTPRARAIMPTIHVTAGANVVLTAKSCDLTAGVTVDVAVEATLEDCSAVWADAGKLSNVRASGFPEIFGGIPPQQTFNGTCGRTVLSGMAVQSLAAVSIVSSRGRVDAGGTGMVASTGLVFYEHEFIAGVAVSGADVFFDLWSWYQINEAAGVITGRVSTQELSPVSWNWGAQNWVVGNFLNPGIKFGTASASASPSDWYCTPRDCRAFDMHAQIAGAIGSNASFTLFAGATLGALVTTGYTVNILAGQLQARNTLAPAGTPIVLPAGTFLAMKVGGPGAGSVNSVDLTLTAM